MSQASLFSFRVIESLSRESAQRQVKSLEPFIISEASAPKLLNFNEMTSSPWWSSHHANPLAKRQKSNRLGGKNLTKANWGIPNFFSQLIFLSISMFVKPIRAKTHSAPTVNRICLQKKKWYQNLDEAFLEVNFI